MSIKFFSKFIMFTTLTFLVVFVTWTVCMYWFFGASFLENFLEDAKNFFKLMIVPAIASGLVATIATDQKVLTVRKKLKE